MNPTNTEIQATVKERFAAVAASPGQENKFPVGPASARKLGYDPTEIDALPATVTESFCGVGNPLGLHEVLPGQTVLDLGSGAGFDSLLAARRVGPTGKVVGVDLCPAMVEKASATPPWWACTTSSSWRPALRSCRCRTAPWTW